MSSIYPQSYQNQNPIVSNNNGIMDELNEAKKKLAEFKSISSSIIQADILVRNYAEKNAECTRLREELEQTKREKSTLNESLKTATSENESLKKTNKEANKEKQELVKKLDEKNSQAKDWAKKELELSKRLNEVELERDAKTREVAELNEQLKKLSETHREALSQIEEMKKRIEQAKVDAEAAAKVLPSTSKSNEDNKVATFYLESSSPSSRSSLADFEDESNEPNFKSLRECQANISLSASSTSPSPKKTGNSGAKTEPQTASQTAPQTPSKTAPKTPSKTTPDTNSTKTSPAKPIAIASSSKLTQESVFGFTLSSSSSSSDSDSEESSSDDDEDGESSSSSTSSSDEEEPIEKKETPNEPPGERLINISDIKLDELDEEENNDKQKQQETAKEEEERVKRAEIEKAEEEKKHKMRMEEEERQEKLISRAYLDMVDEILGDQLNRVSSEWAVSEQVRDKIVNDEVNARMRSLCLDALNEMRKSQIVDQVSTETIEWLMSGGLLTPLIRECCERVLWEARTERAGELFDELLREILVECVDSLLLELAFHDMTSPLKPFIAKIDMNELIATAAAASPKTNAKKRPIDQNSSLLSPSPLESKKPKPNMELDTEMMNPVDEEDLARLQDDIERFAKDFLAAYFRRYNFQQGFTFEELDDMIENFVRAMPRLENSNGRGLENFYSTLIAKILLKHFLNNKYVPLNDLKLIQTDEQELSEFNYVRRFMTGHHAHSMNNSHLSFIRNKLDQQLSIKILSEEEKYVYFVRKLIEYSGFESILNEFLRHLKLMIFNRDMIDSYSFRIGRMIAFLCKANKHQSFMRGFVYDLISTWRKSMPLLFQNLVLQCVRIWPEPFNWPCHVSRLTIDKTLDLDTAARCNPVLCAIIFIVREAIVKNTASLDAQSSSSSSSRITNYSEFAAYYFYTIETLCNWVCDQKSADELCTHFGSNLSIDGDLVQNNDLFILNQEEFKPSLLALEYMSAFKLICASESWEWTSNKFVKGFVRSKLTELRKEHRLDTASKKIVELMAFYFMLKAVVVSFVCPHERFLKDVGSDILKSYGDELQKDQIEFRVVHLAIIESLVSLTPFDPERCMSIIESWISTRVNSPSRFLPASIKSKINFVFKQHNKNSII